MSVTKAATPFETNFIILPLFSMSRESGSYN